MVVFKNKNKQKISYKCGKIFKLVHEVDVLFFFAYDSNVELLIEARVNVVEVRLDH